MAIKSNKQGPRAGKEFILPSGGYPYKGKLPEGRITVYAFNFDAEQVLAGDGDGASKMNGVIPYICNLPEGLEVSDLLAPDQFYILLAARSLSFGASYSFSTSCPACDKPEKHTFTLPEGLPINRVEESFEGYHTFTLPDSQDVVKVRFLTVGDDLSVDAAAKQFKMNARDPGDPGYKFRLAKHVVSVNDGLPESLQEVVAYLSELDGKDPQVFKREIETNQPGVPPLLTIQCPSCSEQYEIPFKMTQEFFRPKW